MSRPRWLRLIAVVMALALAGLPALPALAKAPGVCGGDTHATHGDHDHGAMATDTVAKSTDDVQGCTSAAGAGSAGAACEQHDVCDGKCCAVCAQCICSFLTSAALADPATSVQIAVLPRLHARLLVTAQHRPPQLS